MIIGLSGYAQSGKDTVAKTLVEEYGYTRVAFADAIKDLLYRMDPNVWSRETQSHVTLKSFIDEQGWDEAKKSLDVRRLLQNLGVGARAVLGLNIWVNTALNGKGHDQGNYVITDVRFKNEAKQIGHYDGKIWRVERQGIVAVNDHVSEHDLDDWEFDDYIHNNGTLEDLAFQVKLRMNS